MMGVLGAVVALVQAGVIFAYYVATGALTVAPTINVEPLIVVYLLGFILQGAGEEILTRQFMARGVYNTVLRWTKRPILALVLMLILPSILFSVAHLSNAGTTAVTLLNTGAIGVATGLLVITTGSMIPAFLYHGIWNFITANIIALPVSGHVVSAQLMSTSIVDSNAVGIYGLEGTWVCGITIVLMIVVLGVKCYQMYTSHELDYLIETAR